MLDPKCSNAFISVGERETASSLGVCKTGRIEVQANAAFLGPCNPVLKMLDVDLVAVDCSAGELPIEGVQIESVTAGDERHRLVDVFPQFLRRSRPTWIATGHSESAPDFFCSTLKASDIVSLPAVQRHWNRR